MAQERKRRREADEFFDYQRRVLWNGVPEREEEDLEEEEDYLFGYSSSMEAGINFDAYDEVDVERRGGRGAEAVAETFQECCDKFSLPGELTDNIERCGWYDKPTPVQKHAMPAALAGTDVMVAAQTGSGKTAAFLVPLVSGALRAGAAPLEEGPVCPTSLILAPTRELCQQITVEAMKLCYRTPIRIVPIYGGAEVMPQMQHLAEGCDLAICTPGRLEDFVDRGVMGVERVEHLVLDEADRMLDMGFAPQIRRIVSDYGMPPPRQEGEGDGGGRRQTMMFSATFPDEIQELAKEFLDPAYLWIGVGSVGTASTNVDQRFADVSTTDDDGRFAILVEKLRAEGTEGKTLIFANSKGSVEDVSWRLVGSHIKAKQIHGGLSQTVRERALSDFRDGRIGVLVATDVAARGLDLPGIDHVVNYELPFTAEDYVHRIGRTGRIGNTGVATSLVGASEPALKGIVDAAKSQQAEGAAPLPKWVRRQALHGDGGPPPKRGGGRGGYGGGGQRRGGYKGGGAPQRGRQGGGRQGGGRKSGGGYGGRGWDEDGYGGGRQGGGRRGGGGYGERGWDEDGYGGGRQGGGSRREDGFGGGRYGQGSYADARQSPGRGRW